MSYLSIYLFLHYYPDLQFLNLLVYLHCIQNLHLQKRLLFLKYHNLLRHLPQEQLLWLFLALQ